MFKTLRYGFTALLLSMLSVPFPAYGQQTQEERLLTEYLDFLGGVNNFTQDWTPTGKVGRVYDQLREYTGMDFRVIPGQTYRVGSAHFGGIIVLDHSTVNKPDDVLAFWFAHEWGHLALGHQPSVYHPYGNPDKLAFWRPPTAVEDQADRFAAGFIKAYKYKIAPIVRNLRELPVDPRDVHHSPGKKRASRVQAWWLDMDWPPYCDECNPAYTDCKKVASAEAKVCLREWKQACKPGDTSCLEEAKEFCAELREEQIEQCYEALEPLDLFIESPY